jgi:hypothetical protein
LRFNEAKLVTVADISSKSFRLNHALYPPKLVIAGEIKQVKEGP